MNLVDADSISQMRRILFGSSKIMQVCFVPKYIGPDPNEVLSPPPPGVEELPDPAEEDQARRDEL